MSDFGLLPAHSGLVVRLRRTLRLLIALSGKSDAFMLRTLFAVFALGLTVVLLVTSGSLFVLWVWFELNAFFFATHLAVTGVSSSAVGYFVAQSIGSVLVLSALFFGYSPALLVCALLLKIGLPPAHFWVLNLLKFIDWRALSVLLTLQKVAPLLLVVFVRGARLGLVLVLSASMVCGLAFGFAASSAFVLLLFSSFVHSLFVLVALAFSLRLFMVYVLAYFPPLVLCLAFLNNALFYSCVAAALFGFLVLAVVRLTGFPPFSVFFGKWGVVMLAHGSPFMVGILLLSLGALFFYFRVCLVLLLLK